MLERFEQFSNVIASIHHSIQKIQRTEMAKYGLKGPHAQCLLLMRQHPQGITAARLCELCEKDKAAVSRTISELDAAGMLRRSDVSPKNYRTALFLTETGEQVADKVLHLVSLAVSQAGAGYDDATRETFLRVLNLIAGNLQTICREGLQETPADSERSHYGR